MRRHDRDRYQTVLFAPAARREALFALYAFNYEIARVRESVTEPMLGQIRLQWWRENIAAAFEGGPVRHHPVVEALTGSIRELPMTRDHFDRLINARETDLDDQPPASLRTLEDYAEATSARLIYLALEVLGVHNSAAGEAAQDVGALLLLGLMAAPGGAAQRLTTRPFVGLAISGGIAVVSTWIGVLLSYLIPSLPPSSAILGVATSVYVAAALAARVLGRRAGERSRSLENDDLRAPAA